MLFVAVSEQVKTGNRHDYKGKLQFVFPAVSEVATRMKNEGYRTGVLPLIGSGHANVEKNTAFFALLLALYQALHDSSNLEEFIIVVYEPTGKLPEISEKTIEAGLNMVAALDAAVS